MSATHAGNIPVTPDNSNNLISLGGVELITAKQILTALLLFEKPTHSRGCDHAAAHSIGAA